MSCDTTIEWNQFNMNWTERVGYCVVCDTVVRLILQFDCCLT